MRGISPAPLEDAGRCRFQTGQIAESSAAAACRRAASQDLRSGPSKRTEGPATLIVPNVGASASARARNVTARATVPASASCSASA